MTNGIIQIEPCDLQGPRSYFTDLDPNDINYRENTVKLKLKLQLLTKGKIIVAASSLFHDIGYELFSKDSGLTLALEKGLILPAIRNQYSGPVDFFDQRKDLYSNKSKLYFSKHAKFSVPWDLKQNSTWFKTTFYGHLRDDSSVLREKINFSSEMANDFINQIDQEIMNSSNKDKFLQRKYISKVGKLYGEHIHLYLDNYANLIYRISGSRVVNSEGHFPQSNLTKLGVAGSEKILTEENVFWDIYIETVISYLNSVLRLTPERLEQLSVEDILKIREFFFDIKFAEDYDALISLAKSDIEIQDPQKIILKQSEIQNAASKLRETFRERVQEEIKLKDLSNNIENSLWQIANVLSLFSMPQIGLIIGSLSGLKSIPEITAPFSKSLTNSINARLDWIRSFINSKIGWSRDEKKTLIEGYKKLLSYGIPD